MSATIHQGRDGEMQGRLTTGGADRADAAFQRRQPLFQHGDRRVRYTRIDMKTQKDNPMEKFTPLFLMGTLFFALTACATAPKAASPTVTAVSPINPDLPAPRAESPVRTPAPIPTPAPSAAANADVLFVKAAQAADGTWRFDVTVAHPDTGWEDYADGWDVVLPDGSVVKPRPADPFTRLLVHPHVDEQPFTRSQGGIRIPPQVTQVEVRAHDLRHGFGGRTIVLDLTRSAGPGYEISPAP